MNLNEFEALKRERDLLQRKLAEQEGALRQMTERLQAEFGVEDEAEARRLLKKLEREAEQGGEEYEALLKEFKDKWGGRLDD